MAYGTLHAQLPPTAEIESFLRGLSRLFWKPPMIRRMNLNYAGDEALLTPGTAFPGGTDLTGFPATLSLDAENDRLRASGSAFARKLRRAAVSTDYHLVRGSSHGFLDKPRSPALAIAVSILTAWLSRTDRQHRTRWR